MEKFSHNKETESFAKAYLKENIGKWVPIDSQYKSSGIKE
jgi:hypothetical protein